MERGSKYAELKLQHALHWSFMEHQQTQMGKEEANNSELEKLSPLTTISYLPLVTW